MLSPFLLPMLMQNSKTDLMPGLIVGGYIIAFLLFMLALYPINVFTQTAITLGILDVDQVNEDFSASELIKRSKMNFNFGEILTRAWQIVWKNRVLWIFGILASCGRGGSSFNGSSSGRGDGGFGTPSDFPPQMRQLMQTIQENLTAFIAITVALVCIIWIVTIFLSTIGKIGLIRGTSQVDGGAESLIFGQLFSESTPYFWRMFGLCLIATIPFVVLATAIIAAALAFLM